LRDAFLHCSAETGIAFNQAQCGMLHQHLRIGPRGSRDSCKLGFLLWREMDFHAS